MQFEFGGTSLTLPAGAVIGCIGERDSGIRELLRQAGGKLIGPLDTIDLSRCELAAVEYSLDLQDNYERALSGKELDRARREGARVLLASSSDAVLLEFCDEIWWVDASRIKMSGDPRQVLQVYKAARAARWRALGAADMMPSLRRGDGRAQLLAIDTLDAQGQPVGVWQGGEAVAVRVRVQFQSVVDDPVVGIMIRTRIGMEVFGTNTELENLKLGPRAAGDTLDVTFAFRCELCPQKYILTAASHDPDGVWHDWLEDAVAISVADTRYTAGVANLKAQVTFSVAPPFA